MDELVISNQAQDKSWAEAIAAATVGGKALVVPLPATMSLLGLGGLVMMLRRKRDNA
jgi:hypothetical protein